MDRNSRRTPIRIQYNNFKPSPGEQIQCAVLVPHTPPRIVMVNHSNNIFILRFESGNWKTSPFRVHMDSGRGEIVGVDEKMSIAAMDGAVRLFWMQGQEGRMLSFDISEAEQGHQYQPKSITTPF